MLIRLGVTVSQSTISYWVRGIYNPFPRPPEMTPRPTQYPHGVGLKPSPVLAYIIGAVLGE